MGKLNQLVAIQKGVKARVHVAVTDLYKLVQKPALFNGFDKHYQSQDSAGVQLPPERQLVQENVPDVLAKVGKHLSELMDVEFRMTRTNQAARADVILDGEVLLEQVPGTYLIFLEKQLVDFRTMISHLPVLDPTETWGHTPDAATGLWKSVEVRTHRTEKRQEALVKYPATDKHPAQTEMIIKDVIAGYWHLTKVSGAITRTRKIALMHRVEKLLKAVITAREQANMTDEVDTSTSVGNTVFAYLTE